MLTWASLSLSLSLSLSHTHTHTHTHTHYTQAVSTADFFHSFWLVAHWVGQLVENLGTSKDWQNQLNGELNCKFSLFVSLFLSGAGYEDGHVSSQPLLIKKHTLSSLCDREISSSWQPIIFEWQHLSPQNSWDSRKNYRKIFCNR